MDGAKLPTAAASPNIKKDRNSCGDPASHRSICRRPRSRN